MQPVNTVLEYAGYRGFPSRCGLRIEPLRDGRVLVICTELPDNPGTSVTNFCEEIAMLVCRRYEIDPRRLAWVEHYPAGGTHGPKADWD